MLRKYLVLSLCVAMAAIVFWHTPAIAAMPENIRSCLTSPQFSVPKQYKEIARIRSGQTTYFYIARILDRNNPLPETSLISVQANKCKNLAAPLPVVPHDEPLTKYVPKDVANYLATAKWKMVLSHPKGRELIRTIQSSKFSNASGGDVFNMPLNVSQFDITILKKLGAIKSLTQP
jgi:hypothetical protein